MQVEVGDDRLDRHFAARVAFIKDVLFAGNAEARQWNAVLCDELDPKTYMRVNKERRELQFDRKWINKYWREKRLWLAEAEIVNSILDTICSGDAGDSDFCALLAKVEERAAAAGETQLAAELQFVMEHRKKEMEWADDDAEDALDETPERLRQLLDAVLRKYNDFAARLTAVRTTVSSRKTEALFRSTERHLNTALALNGALVALAALLTKPKGDATFAAAERAYDDAMKKWCKAFHLARVLATNAHEGTLVEEVILRIAEEALLLALDVSDTFCATWSEPFDIEIAKRFSATIGAPLEWIAARQYRHFWLTMRDPAPFERRADKQDGDADGHCETPETAPGK